MPALSRSVMPTRFAGIALIVTAFVTACLLIYQGKYLSSRSSEIETLADLATQSFQSSMDLYTYTAYGARGLWDSDDDAVSRTEFHRYIESLNVPRRMPGLSVISMLTLVADTDKNKFLAEVHRDKSLDLVDTSKYAIWPAAEKDQYLLVTYAEPSNMSNIRNTLGFDYGSEPLRLVAFETAVKTDEAIMTQPVPSAVNKIQSFFLFLPIFDQTKPNQTPTERQKAALGAIVLGFRSERLFNNAFGLFLEHNPDLVIRVFDGTAADEAKLIYDSTQGKKVLGATYPSEKITEVRTTESVGRTWTFEFSATKTGGKNSTREPLLIMVIFLVLISAMGGALLMKRPKHPNVS